MNKLTWREKTMCGGDLFLTKIQSWIATTGRVYLGWVFSNLYPNIIILSTHSVDQKIDHHW